MKLTAVPQELRSFIDSHDSFFIIPHLEPDGDCIGSALATASLLRRLGKLVYLHNMGPFEKRDVRQYATQFSGRISKELRNQAPNPAVIVLDCSTLDRIGPLAEDIHGLALAVIDHHSAGVEFGTVRFINPSAPSTSVMVQQLIESFGMELTVEEAQLIFFAFCTDTGFFRHLDQGSSQVFPLVSRMVAAGASPKNTYLEMNSGASLAGRQHLGTMLSRAEKYRNGEVLLCWELKEETDAIGKANRESDLLYQMLMGIEGVEVIIVLREERKNFITGGLRSKRFIDVGQLALSLGGGGHARAAGFGLETDLNQAKAILVERVLAAFPD